MNLREDVLRRRRAQQMRNLRRERIRIVIATVIGGAVLALGFIYAAVKVVRAAWGP